MLPPNRELPRSIAARLDELLRAETCLSRRLATAIALVPGRLAFSTSLSMEDQAVLHGIATADTDKRIDTFMLDTGRHFPETLELVATSEDRFGRRIGVIAPDRTAVEQLVQRDGVLGFRMSVDARKACCDVRKVVPLRRSLVGAAAWITGLRREQSAGRADVALAAWDDAHALIKINPIADWSVATLTAYIDTHAIPISPLHAQGFPSIGCMPCTRAVRPGEDVRAGRWWWEAQDGKECGLHNAPHRKTPQRESLKETAA